MAEGLLGSVLGNEEEKSEAEAGETLASPEAFAAAVAARLAVVDPELARETSNFLRKQAKLLETQNRHLEVEHAFHVSRLKGQSQEGKLRRAGIRIRLAFQFCFAFLAAFLGIALVIMVRDALASRSVVIDAFEISPGITDQVPNGRMVAAGLLDVLTRIQAATKLNAQRRSLSNAWTGDIAIEVPETRVSIGDIERLLKTRFGHDQHIDGDVVRAEKGGLALTVRGSGILPRTFVGPAENLDDLLMQAGEYVYGQSQPALWAQYLTEKDRNDEAIKFCEQRYLTVADEDRPYLLNSWANAIAAKGGSGAMNDALPLYREALRLKADYWNAYNNIMFALGGMGNEEGIVKTGQQMIKAAGGRPGRAREIDYQNYDLTVWDLTAQRAAIVADLEASNGVGTLPGFNGAQNLSVAQLDAQMHDVDDAAMRLRITPIDSKNLPDVALAAFDHALLAEERSDLKAAVIAWDAFAAAFANPEVATSNPNALCFAAVSYEKAGLSAKADAALDSPGPLTYVDCYRFKGDVLDLRGNWPGAQEWYAKAVQLAPSMPAGYYSWGLGLMRHGALDSAAEKFAQANARGPHWADPLKAWGDLLLLQNRPREALAKYDQALKYAPKWTALKEARERARS
jgi:tetratricopeptide (TPR) repeat protein